MDEISRGANSAIEHLELELIVRDFIASFRIEGFRIAAWHQIYA